ncbi:MAG TPA: VCBS repeat-containing protein, partial [Armatimonadota bacterium]|nr:VCBS repeat-containing protein [Armatimonadota bacterium]
MTVPAALLPVLALVAVLSGCGGVENRSPAAAAATAGGGTPVLRFTDVQDAAGLRFVHTDGGSGRKYFVEQFCSGCAFFDYDNDGFLDVYAVNGAPLPGTKADAPPRHRLFHNRGDGTFEDVTERSGMGSTRFGGGVCAGDFDNDGWTDLYVTCFGKNHLYRNVGNGTFKDIAEAAGVAGDGGISTSCTFLDYDNDGKLDLYVCHYVRYRLADDRFCGEVKRGKSYCGPEVFPSHPDSLYHNNGDGTFKDVSKSSGIVHPLSKSLGVVATDINNDGWIDLYVACDLVRNLLFINQKNGTFKEAGVAAGVAYSGDGAAEAGMGVSAGDYDNDGKMDLFVTNYSFEQNALYHNEGNGIFSY